MNRRGDVDGHAIDLDKIVAVSKIYTSLPREIFKETGVEVYFDVHFLHSQGTMRVHRSKLDDDQVQPAIGELNKVRDKLLEKL